MSSGQLRPSEALRGRTLLLTGGTGFLGKVFVSLLLDRFPELGRVDLLVRSAGGAEQRFRDQVLPSPAFEPLFRRYGSGLAGFLAEKLAVVEGDVGEPDLGLGEAAAARIASECDVVVNCAAHVSFTAPLDVALRANVLGVRHAVAFARRLRRPALVHVSTCYVVGNRSGEVWEDEPVLGYFPNRGGDDQALSPEAETVHCEGLVARAREEAEDPALGVTLQRAARRRLLEEAKDPDDERALRIAVAQERKAWLRRRLAALGAERARAWGWSNAYTYTKSLGEQLVAGAGDVVRSIVRPSIIESALSFPFPGWNEGFTTTAPIIQLAIQGHSHFPVRGEVILDLVPVDAAASGLLGVVAQACVEQPPLVYQLGSSDSNPLRLKRAAVLMELYRRKRARARRKSGGGLRDALTSRLQIRTVDPDSFERLVLPAVKGVVGGSARLLERIEARGLGLTGWAREAQRGLKRALDSLRRGEEQLQTFRPFMADNQYVFRAGNARALFRRFPASERERIQWSPESIDWADYWVEVHCPGLERWVLPKLDGSERKPRRAERRTLLELFEGATKAHSQRVAAVIERGGRLERFRYGELRECTLRAAALLHERGIGAGDRVALLAENSPEWGMGYFGIVRCGAACVPIASDAGLDEILGLLRAAEAKALLLSEDAAAARSGLARRVAAAGLAVDVVQLRELFAPTDPALERERLSRLPGAVSPDAVASILFTSGSTGPAKGVMLTHRNFTNQIAQLGAVYDLDHRDGMLSVLPLQHSFEFSAGFLLPFSRGARIHYLDELSGDAIARALRSGRITCMVGVPALWDLMRRRLLGGLRERAPRLAALASGLIAWNGRLRDESPFNFGPLLFLPLHLALGGRIRYLISGGAALSQETARAFRGMGFQLLEGYGLTEAAPVLCVNRPGDAAVSGGVGPPLPGVELRIALPDAEGVGEVIARGPGVMAGYYGDREATREALRDGWLRTGDLGRLDPAGRLHLVGRLKEVIVGPDGKNAYPDEIETLYGEPALMRELCVVGLRDAASGAERVACLAVPKPEQGVSGPRLLARIERHVRRVSARLPAHKRIRVLEIWEGELPRTATRKVKRGEVAALIERLRQREERPPGRPAPEARLRELRGIVAEILGRPAAEVSVEESLDQLGFDSLMQAELLSALEAASVRSLSVESIARCRDLRELAAALGRRNGSAAPVDPQPEPSSRELHIPPLIRTLGRHGLELAERLLYRGVLNVAVRGEQHVPVHTPFIAAANHASHLDAGLVRAALGDAGRKLVVLAAADYFFDTPLKRAVFSNFADVLPIERGHATAESLRPALAALEQGFNLLVFPEGTRSRDGRVQPFERGVGYLAMRSRVGVLPLRLSTHHALPPGSVLLKSRSLEARIGPLLEAHSLARLTSGLPRPEAEREVARAVQRAVEELGNGVSPRSRARVGGRVSAV